MSSLPLWTQLIRNALCVLKSLLPNNSLLLQVPGDQGLIANLMRYIGFGILAKTPRLQSWAMHMPKKTMFIEYMISLTQFAASYFNLRSGWIDVLEGRRNVRVLNTWLKMLDRIAIHSEKVTASRAVEYYALMRSGIVSDRFDAHCRVLGGFLQLVFGASFLFLGLNSLHFFDSDVKPVVNALLCMEIGLLYFLWIMWKSWTKSAADSKVAKILANKLESFDDPNIQSGFLPLIISSGDVECDTLFDTIITYSDIIEGNGIERKYMPSWRQSSSSINSHDIELELLKIKHIVDQLSMIFTNTKSRNAVVSCLNCHSTQLSNRSFLELYYLILNFIAGYGYMLGCLAFYFPENGTSLAILGLCRISMFGMSHSQADWWGNLAGDFAWTVEPLTMLVVQYVRWKSTINTSNATSISSFESRPPKSYAASKTQRFVKSKLSSQNETKIKQESFAEGNQLRSSSRLNRKKSN